MPGIRMISPAHFFDTAFGGSAHGVEQGGLTAKGREMVRRMEARGVMLDVAHSSARTIDDALAVATRPVVASHTGVRGVLDNARNLSDAHLDGIAATGGLVGIGFWPTARVARTRRPSPARSPTRWTASGPSTWPSARTGTAPCRCRSTPANTRPASRTRCWRRAWTRTAIRAVMGENVLRVLAAALPDGLSRDPRGVRYPRAMRTTEQTVLNPSGLHARPAAMFVKTAAGFASKVTLENLDRGSAPVDAKSILEVMGAGVRKGHHIRVTAEGPDEDAAIETLEAFIDGGMGETIPG